jgi:hypothetical protein
MMGKASTLAIAVVGSLAIATAGESFAAPIPSDALAIKAATPAAATDVQYFDSGYGPYAAYPYRGYRYWYPSYGNWVYPDPGYYYYPGTTIGSSRPMRRRRLSGAANPSCGVSFLSSADTAEFQREQNQQ